MLHRSEKNTSLKYMYFSCQITKRELDPGATDVFKGGQFNNEKRSNTQSMIFVIITSLFFRSDQAYLNISRHIQSDIARDAFSFKES
jgi:hypothetical protein